MLWPYLIKLNIYLAYDPTILRLGISSREMKTHVHKRIGTKMFGAFSLMIAQNCKQLKCSLTENIIP